MSQSKNRLPAAPRRLALAALGCAAAGVAFAAAPLEDRNADRAAARAETELVRGTLESVDSFYLPGGAHRWTMVDDDTVIVWATAFRPYLIDFAFPSVDLRHADSIALTSLGNRVYAKFDAVSVAGLRYPIDRIYKLTREEAKARTASS